MVNEMVRTIEMVIKGNGKPRHRLGLALMRHPDPPSHAFLSDDIGCESRQRHGLSRALQPRL